MGPRRLPLPGDRGPREGGQGHCQKTDDALVDAVLLSGAAETEHHEIAVYEGLIAHAHAMGKGEVVELLKQNLEQEQHTLDEVERATEKAAAATSGQPV